ncbi:MAG: DUF975 family protein [Clostridia bacterium]|nr:DUF975 family protein [Clostridia bacterium]
MIDRPLLKTNAKMLMRKAGFKIFWYTLFFIIASTAADYVIQIRLPKLYTYINAGDPDGLIDYITTTGGSLRLLLVVAAIMLVYNLFVAIIGVGYKRTCLMVARDEKVAFRDMFETFGYWVKIIGLRIAVAVVTGIATLCFIIPGIILSFAYAQAEFVLIDNPDIGIIEAMRRSRKLMKGYKFEFFVFRLSYILWDLLSALFAITYVYVLPYVTVGEALFYEHLCGYRNFSERKNQPVQDTAEDTTDKE